MARSLHLVNTVVPMDSRMCTGTIPNVFPEITNGDQMYPNVSQDASWQGKGMTSCNVLYNTQMLVIGGIAENNSSLPCDEPGIAGQHALQLDLAGLSTPWLAPLPTKTAYQVPPAITAVIGGG